jgi:3-oxoacyl-[acyl-carrier-protein] synthase II
MDNPASRRVVITGLGVVTSIGHDVDSFWSSLVAGRCGIERVTLFDPADFACQIGAEVRNWDAAQKMDPKEAR